MIKKLAKFIKGYWKPTILTPLLVVMETVMEILIPFLMADLVDNGIYKGDMDVITKMGFILLGCALVSLVFGVGAAILAPYASSGFGMNFRKAMYYKVQGFSFSSIDKFSTSSIITRLTTDVTNVQQAFQMLTRICFRAPCMIVFALIAAFRINAKLSLVYIAAMPVLLIGAIVLAKKALPIFKKIFRTYDKLNSVVQENLHAQRVVKSYNRQDFEIDKFKKVSNELFGYGRDVELTMAWIGPLMQGAMYICFILISWFGARMILASGNNEAYGLTTGQLMSMITFAIQILMSLLMLSIVAVMMLQAKESGNRIIELLEEESEINNPLNPVMVVPDGSIDFEHVYFRYLNAGKDETKNDGAVNADAERKDVLSDISIHIPSGSTVGILGATGSSKTSLVSLIPRLYDVNKGSVKVGGIDVRNYDLTTLRNKVAMVLQKNILFSGTVSENLRWGNERATKEEIKAVCQIACADDFIEKFDKKYDEHIEQGGANVSGGQRQRLCIARALLKNPKILILDDSTSACDMETDRKIRDSLKNMMPDVTKIVIAQRISTVEDSDIIIVMDEGKIAACGKHEELLKTSDIYREVYIAQNKDSDEAASLLKNLKGGEM